MDALRRAAGNRQVTGLGAVQDLGNFLGMVLGHVLKSGRGDTQQDAVTNLDGTGL